MTQPGFDFAAPTQTPVQRRHAAADRALAKVTRERGRLWLEQASHAIGLYAVQHAPGWLFEDARAWACWSNGKGKIETRCYICHEGKPARRAA